MRSMENNALYNGYRLCKNAPAISHLMFADDLLLFGTFDNRTEQTPMHILHTYAGWSGQKANMQKSAILFIKGVNEDRRTEVVGVLGVKQMEINDKYLGHQLLKPGHRSASFEFLNDKFDNKLAGWKGTHFTHAGRTIMIKHVLGLIPLFYMATSIIPKKNLASMTRTMRNFWWGHSRDTKKTHFINWSHLELTKEQGGLGIRPLQILNKAYDC